MALPQTSNVCKMAKYDEKTVARVNMNMVAKLTFDSNEKLLFVNWNRTSHSIITGGTNSCLRMIKMNFGELGEKPRPFMQMNRELVTKERDNITVFRGLILDGTWNEQRSRIATTDSSGCVTIWNVTQDDQCLRSDFHDDKPNDSVLAIGVCWSPDGNQLVIAYSNGLARVYSWIGFQYYKIEVHKSISLCEWCPIGDKIIFGTAEGQILVYNSNGTYSTEVKREEGSFEKVRAGPLDEIVCMKYWRARHHPAIPGDEVVCPKDRPRFVIAYRRVVLQLMRSIEDKEPIIVRLPNIKITGADWSANGLLLAVCGYNLKDTQHSMIHVLTAYGKPFGTFNTFDHRFNAISWEATGVHLAVTSARTLYVLDVRPDYKWGALGAILVYVYPTRDGYNISAFNPKTAEKNERRIRNFENIAFAKTQLVVITSRLELAEKNYICELMDSGLIPLAHHHTTTIPKFAAANEQFLVVASEDRYSIWTFETQQMTEYQLRNQLKTVVQAPPIYAICIGDSFFLLALRDHGICRINLNDGMVTARYPMESTVVESMKLNCDFTRLAMLKVSRSGLLRLYIFTFLPGGQLHQLHSWLDREVWSYEWHSSSANQIVLSGRGGSQVVEAFEDTKRLMTQPSCWPIFLYKESSVTVFHLNEIFLNPENPPQLAFKTFQC